MSQGMSEQPTSDTHQRMSRDRHSSSAPTKILLLTNIISKEDVDEDLNSEMKRECTKYGRVRTVLVHIVNGRQVHPDDAVRIFVHYETVDEAKKGHSQLSDRYFAGRKIRATYYNEDMFIDGHLDS
ncbi:hypothetical protein SAMD00019534_080010 [Acytostelium subglobosum LB1]|uniref:hypothetical protein n=1 Tax=Acytostelium subglobosum LB1 TaxID=1410327 RepID=UPI000644D88F|nr:hypothetical protein SAMD00019534_080010 [Acytostelium subglobosum LB1]GAM24826.1 hypothetical protein SAMD00019534_080010 [Acytostelium subglobosum LB1]|eukprot:XP_012752495.1 hypothetical protein SAMD00019534_080010 [Acytostelium subglobosum LB1]